MVVMSILQFCPPSTGAATGYFRWTHTYDDHLKHFSHCRNSPEPWRCAGSLPERSLPGRQQDVGDQLCGALGREEGVDQGGADLATEADV